MEIVGKENVNEVTFKDIYQYSKDISQFRQSMGIIGKILDPLIEAFITENKEVFDTFTNEMETLFKAHVHLDENGIAKQRTVAVPAIFDGKNHLQVNKDQKKTVWDYKSAEDETIFRQSWKELMERSCRIRL